MSRFNYEDLGEIIANPGSSLVQMLALQLREELVGNAILSQMEADNNNLRNDNQKLREQRDAANVVIQELNRIIAGDVE